MWAGLHGQEEESKSQPQIHTQGVGQKVEQFCRMEQVDVHHVVLSSGVVFDVILNFIPEILLQRKKKEKSVGFFFVVATKQFLKKTLRA